MKTLIYLFTLSLVLTSCSKEEELYIGSDWTRFPEWPQGEWKPNPNARDKTLSTPPKGAKPGVRFLLRDTNFNLYILNWNGDVIHEETGALREEIRQMHLDYEEYLARKGENSSEPRSRYGSTTSTERFEADFDDESSSTGTPYRSRVTPEMARSVAGAVYKHSLSQQRVQVRGHTRENSYVEPYSRTPAGGYSAGDHLEAGAKGAAAAGGLMLLDWVAQKLESSAN